MKASTTLARFWSRPRFGVEGQEKQAFMVIVPLGVLLEPACYRPANLGAQLLFPRRRHLRSRRCTGSLPKYPGQLRKALGEWVRFGPGLARWLSQGWDGARRHRVIPPLRATH